MRFNADAMRQVHLREAVAAEQLPEVLKLAEGDVVSRQFRGACG